MIVMDSQGRLGKILVGMNRALGESECFSLIPYMDHGSY
jgi:hypothetical protein